MGDRFAFRSPLHALNRPRGSDGLDDLRLNVTHNDSPLFVSNFRGTEK